MMRSNKLRLNFNERSDYISPIESDYPYEGNLWQYPERQNLEAMIANEYQLSADQVLCTNGGDEAIMILMRLILESAMSNTSLINNELQPLKMILPLPAFSQYTWGVESWQLDAELIPGEENLGIDIDSTLTSIKDSDASVTIITRPNNPSGELISMADLRLIIQQSAQNNGWVFLDEAYIEFSEEASVARNLINEFDNLVVLRTLSKAYGLAGIRVGYLIGSEALIAQFNKRCAPFNIPRPSLDIAEQALLASNRADVKNYCQKIIDNRNALYQWLKDNQINVLPSQANFLVLQLVESQARAIESFLGKKGILVRSFTDDAMLNCLRITIPYNTEALKVALEQALLPKLICLDMDGVLIDTSDSYDATTIATVKKLAKIDISVHDIEKLKTSGGYNNDWVVTQRLLADNAVEMSLDEVTAVFQELYLGMDTIKGLVENERSLLSNDTLKYIQKSSKAAKPTFAIVTGRPLSEARAGQALIDLTELDLISLDCVANPKPAPDGIHRLQEKYSAMSWMCGDNPDDMQAAVASNSLAIGIGTVGISALYEAGADVVLNEINELTKWLCPQLKCLPTETEAERNN